MKSGIGRFLESAAVSAKKTAVAAGAVLSMANCATTDLPVHPHVRQHNGRQTQNYRVARGKADTRAALMKMLRGIGEPNSKEPTVCTQLHTGLYKITREETEQDGQRKLQRLLVDNAQSIVGKWLERHYGYQMVDSTHIKHRDYVGPENHTRNELAHPGDMMLLGRKVDDPSLWQAFHVDLTKYHTLVMRLMSFDERTWQEKEVDPTRFVKEVMEAWICAHPASSFMRPVGPVSSETNPEYNVARLTFEGNGKAPAKISRRDVVSEYISGWLKRLEILEEPLNKKYMQDDVSTLKETRRILERTQEKPGEIQIILDEVYAQMERSYGPDWRDDLRKHKNVQELIGKIEGAQQQAQEEIRWILKFKEELTEQNAPAW